MALASVAVRSSFAAIRHSTFPQPIPSVESDLIAEQRLSDGNMTSQHRIFTMKFSSVYPLYVHKAERKGRTQGEVDQIICWLTGYSIEGLRRQIEVGADFRTFFAHAPVMHPNCSLIKGVVCGVRVEDVEDPLMQKIRYLDKLVDELAKGKSMEKILRH